MQSSDITNNLTTHPDTHQLLFRTDTRAITQSIKNLILTDKYERPFQPSLGGGIRHVLFEDFSSQTTDTLTSLIRETIDNFEQRARVVDLQVVPQELQNTYLITVVYFAKNAATSTTIQLTLNRVR